MASPDPSGGHTWVLEFKRQSAPRPSWCLFPDSSTLPQEFEGGFRFRSTWQQTYLLSAQLVGNHVSYHRQPLRVQGFHSDLLYQPWFCATTPLRHEWLERDTLERRAGLSVPDFQRLYERPNRPVVLTDVVREARCFACLNTSATALARAIL